MTSLGEILRGMTERLPSAPGQKLSDENLQALLAHEEKQRHRRKCPLCSGNDPRALCTNDPEYRQKIKYRAAGVPFPARMTFDAFKIVRGTEKAIVEAKLMADSPQSWLTLLGMYGTGKSHLAMAAVYTRLQAGHFAWFITSGKLLDRWRSWFDRKDEQFDFSERFERDCNAPYLVVVDDLGSERGTEWATERLTMFLDHRYGRNLPTVITTNYPKEVLAERSGGRIADRVFDRRTGMVKVVYMDCSSYRTGKG